MVLKADYRIFLAGAIFHRVPFPFKWNIFLLVFLSPLISSVGHLPLSSIHFPSIVLLCFFFAVFFFHFWLLPFNFDLSFLHTFLPLSFSFCLLPHSFIDILLLFSSPYFLPLLTLVFTLFTPSFLHSPFPFPYFFSSFSLSFIFTLQFCTPRPSFTTSPPSPPLTRNSRWHRQRWRAVKRAPPCRPRWPRSSSSPPPPAEAPTTPGHWTDNAPPCSLIHNCNRRKDKRQLP